MEEKEKEEEKMEEVDVEERDDVKGAEELLEVQVMPVVAT